MPQGRKPKPRAIREREGNPGKRPLPEPVVVGGAPAEPMTPPAHLEDEAKDFWSEAITVLERLGILDTIDSPALEAMATAYARMRQAQREVQEVGLTTYGANGQLVEHPAVKVERYSAKLFLQYAEHFALTPVARTRLGLAQVHAAKGLQDLAPTPQDAELEPA